MRTGAELKVGVITVLALALLAGYTFYLRGYRVATSTYSICVIFDNARGLQRGDPVRMAGVKIGEVTSVEISEKLKAEVSLSVARRYDLYDDYRFQIATVGIIQERFVEVLPAPPNPYAQKLAPGACVDGVLTPSLADLMAAGTAVLDNLNRTSRVLNALLADQEILGGVREALVTFSRAAASASELAEATAALARASEPELLVALRNLRQAAEDVQAITGLVRAEIAAGRILGDLEETTRHARLAAENAERASASLADLAGDPAIQAQLRQTLAAAHAAAQSARQIGADLEAFSGEVRKAAPVVPRLAREAEEIAETSETLRDRLKPPEIDAAFDILYSGGEDRWFSGGRLDFSTQQERFFRIGMDDIGEENLVNVQVGERQRKRVLRYGLVRSRLGVGLDLDLPRRTTLSVDIFDPNSLRADVLAEVPIVPGRSEWNALVGVRDIGDEALFVGGLRLKR